MTDVVMLSGSPGSGKTTIARRLAQTFPLSVHLHTDDFWHAIVSGSIPPYLPESAAQNQTVVGVSADAAFGFAAGGYTTIVDGIVGSWMLDHYLRSASRAPGVTLHYVVLRPDRLTALSRAQQRSDPTALVDEQPILELWDQFADLGRYSQHAVDTSSLDVEATLTLVSAAVRRGSHTLTAD